MSKDKMTDFDIVIGDVTVNTSMIEEDVIRERFALCPAEESTEEIKRPSEEEYLKAKENISNLQCTIKLAHERILALVDTLTREKYILDSFTNTLDSNKKTVLVYETYKELEGGK